MKKIHKGRLFGILALSAATIAVASVGFATWVLSGTTNGKTGNVSVTVADVVDNRLEIKNAAAQKSSSDTTAATLVFDAVPSGSETTGGGTIFSQGTGSATESLSFYVKYDLVVGESITDMSKVSVAATLSFASSSGSETLDSINSYESSTLLNIPSSFTTISNTSTSTGTGTKTYAQGFTVTFAWGAYFNNKNPYLLTSSDVNDTKTVDKYKGALQQLKKLDSGNFTVTLTPSLTNS